MSTELTEIKQFAGAKRIGDLTEQDHINYLKAKVSGQLGVKPTSDADARREFRRSVLQQRSAAAQASTSSETMNHEVVTQLRQERVGQTVPQRLTRDERDFAYALDNDEVYTNRVVNVSIPGSRWEEFLNESMEKDVTFPLKAIKMGGEQHRSGSVNISKVRFSHRDAAVLDEFLSKYGLS